MKQLKKTILTLVALLAVTTGAWAQGYNVTFGGLSESEMNTTVNVASLPQTFTAIGNAPFYPWTVISTSGNYFHDASVTSGGEGKVSVSFGDQEMSITITGPFEGTATIHVTGEDDEERNISTNITVSCEAVGGVASSGPEVAWDKATKTGTFTMPGGNVELEPEYYPQAALTAAPTAINDVPATTDGAIVEAGTVANIGSTTTAQGTVMYYVSPTALDDAALLALAADQWTADVPTAADLTEGQAYVYYYVRGNDSDTDEENFSDGDILAANALTVTIAAEPTYAVTFAEGTDPNEWTASPNADVKKGQTVTVNYSGPRKVMSVKAEKKEAAPAEGKTYTNLQGGEVLHVGDKIAETEGKFRYTPSDSYYTYLRSFNTYEVLRADVAYEDYNYKYTESPDGQYYVLKHTYYDDDREEWVTAYYFNQDLPVTGTSDGITVTLDGQDGSQRNLYTFWVHEPNQ